MGILRREPGAAACVFSDCGTAADIARGAATAPAITLPVVARKPLRVGERGANLSSIEFLDVECDQRNIIRMTENWWAKRKCAAQKAVKAKTARCRAVLGSWVELL